MTCTRCQQLITRGEKDYRTKLGTHHAECPVKLCRFCDQPMKPPGMKKKPNEYDHAAGCPYNRSRRLCKHPERDWCPKHGFTDTDKEQV